MAGSRSRGVEMAAVQCGWEGCSDGRRSLCTAAAAARSVSRCESTAGGARAGNAVKVLRQGKGRLSAARYSKVSSLSRPTVPRSLRCAMSHRVKCTGSD